MSGMSPVYLREQLLDRRARLTSLGEPAESDEVTRLLGEVDSALQRLDHGTYGICGNCHEGIEADRLTADPLTTFCLDCLTLEQRNALQRDLDSAAQVQGSLLPTRDFQFPGWEFDYHYEPLGPVSGDYFDLIAADEWLYFFFGDVAGKGVAASLLMAQLHTLFRSLVTKRQALDKMVFEANNLFTASTLPHAYATLLVGRVEREGKVEICNAGHQPPQLLHGRGVDALKPGGFPFGLFPSVQFEPVTVALERGDSLFLYTDGLSEARDETGQEYGEQRLQRILESGSRHTAAETIQRLLEDLAEHRRRTPLTDDLTTMVIRRL